MVCSPAFADDARHVTSPNGELEFRIFVTPPEPGGWIRLGYQILVHGKPMMDTAFLGVDILEQEPILGENVGLIASKAGSDGATARYNSLVAEYMQNGSLGRRLNVEARAYDDGIAFRYVIPSSTPLVEILIADEATEFQIANDLSAPVSVPFATGQIAITEVRHGDYPEMSLARLDASHLVSRLAATPYRGKAPLITPWRVVVFGPAREHVKDSQVVRDLSR